MLLNVVVWLQFAMEVFGWGWSEHPQLGGYGGSKLVPQGSSRATLFAYSLRQFFYDVGMYKHS